MADAGTPTAAVDEAPVVAPDAPGAPVDDSSLLAAAGKDQPSLLGEGDKKAEDDGEKTPEPKAPEEYADFTFPDGVEVDANLMAEFKPLAKELNLTQEQAQKLVDFQAKHASTMQAAQEEAYNQQVAGWRAEITAMPGSKEMLSNARRSLDAYAADPEVRHFLTDTWLGDHPLMIKFLAAVGKAAAEDTFAGSSSPPARSRDARGIYHTMPNA